ncbi:MAG: arginine--tRNA ligase [Oscillospiraceae bacterium]|nr:arginine--tRNA ligase [Oscillospiraceae bacterium]
MSDFETRIYEATREAVRAVWDIEAEEGLYVVETPQNPDFGDYSTNVAMKLSRTLRRSPMDIAAPIAEKLAALLPEAESVTVARPGFINFKLRADALSGLIDKVIEAGENYGRNESGKGRRVLVEWVSANPTGRLHCGHARNAAWGDCICRLMEFSGYDVLREYYVNDAGNQIVMLGRSLSARYFEYFGRGADCPMPEDGYHAEDIRAIAAEIAAKDGDRWLKADERERMDYFMRVGKELELKRIEEDLLFYRVRIDSWMHETFFYENDRARINACLRRMEEMGLLYEQDGALWFRSSDYGDDKDRVLRKSDGTLSYLTPDIANHVYKVERGYPMLVDLWGADHHSYITRMQAALTALGYPEGTLAVDLIQMVRMVEDGKEVKMSKRTGNALSLRELCEDISVDAARWFFVSKDVATHMDLDLKLARSRDNDNPVYYAQYAHARMNSILTNPKIARFEKTGRYDRLTDERELQLLKKIGEFPAEVAADAAMRKPNRMTDYIISLVKTFHAYYNAVKVNNPDDAELTNQRLGLVTATMITLRNALALIGVSAPESM